METTSLAARPLPALLKPRATRESAAQRALIAERGDGTVAAFGDDVTIHPDPLAAVSWLREQVSPAAAAGRPVMLGLACRNQGLVAEVFKPYGVTVIGKATPGSMAIGDYMERVLGPAPAPEPGPERAPRTIVVAADASWQPGRPRKGAWAAVREDGVYLTGLVSSRSTKYGPEEQALHAVFRQWERMITHPDDRLILLSDSVHAVTEMNLWLPYAAVPRFNRDRVIVRWVKGHAGHPLNEAADRLAVTTRRARPGVINRKLAARLAREGAEEFTADRERWLRLIGLGGDSGVGFGNAEAA